MCEEKTYQLMEYRDHPVLSPKFYQLNSSKFHNIDEPCDGGSP